MKHDIPPAPTDAWRAGMAEAVKTCVHCGFCLPACPTYQVLGQEMDSPRGRIVLMKEVLEGHTALEVALPHIDRCLGCLGCETACPSGVKYRELISPFRQMAAAKQPRGLMDRMRRFSMLQSVPHPSRFRVAAKLGSLAKPFRSLMPMSFHAMLDLLPSHLPPAQKLESRYPAKGTQRAKIALLAGCAQQVLAPGINEATIDVLTRNGVEVLVPKSQGCCGAMSWHVGAGAQARAFARKNLAAFPTDVDAILTNAAGCGSGLHEYPMMLAGTADEEAAKKFAHRVQDISTFLINLGIEAPPALAKPIRVAYHDACHLSHGQGVRSAPRELLKAIPGLELMEIPDGEICCGSAGSYNIDQPEIAAQLGKRKADAILSTGADWLATGNIGCITQIEHHLCKAPQPVKVRHTLEILAMAYAGKL